MDNLNSYLSSIQEDIKHKYQHIKFLGKYDVTVDSGDDSWKKKIKDIERNFTSILRKVSSAMLPLYKKQCLKTEVDKSKCNVSPSEFMKMIPVSHIIFYSDGKTEGCKLMFSANNLFENPFISVSLKSISNPNSAEISLEG